MKLKTALELLGHVGDDDVDCDDPGCKMCRECEHHEPCNCMIDELVRRAREEAYEMAAKVVEEGVREVGTEPCGLGPDECDSCKREAELVARIRALSTEPK